MQDKKRIIMIVSAIALVVLIFGILIYNKFSNNNSVSREKVRLVENYISQNYEEDFKIKNADFVYYESGITGGLYRYTFECEDKNGKRFDINYRSYIDLSENTVSDLTISK